MNRFRTPHVARGLAFALVAGALVFPAGGFGQKPPPAAPLNPGEKLNHIIVPRVEMSNAPLADALEFLRIRSVDLDTTVPEDQPGRGINFILKDPDGQISETEVSLTLTRVPLKTVLEYITRFAGATYRVDGRGIVIGKPEHLGGDAGMLAPGRLGDSGRRIFARLRDTRLAEVIIEDATLVEAIQYFRAASVPSRSSLKDGNVGGNPGAGLNFIVRNPEKPMPKFSLHLQDVPLGTALRYACELSGVVYAIHPNAVAVGSADDFIPRPVDPGAHAYGRSGIRPGGAALAAKLKNLTVPKVELSSVSLEDALALIRAVAFNTERSAGVTDPKGINIVNLAHDNTQRISLNLADIPAWELMSYITSLTETEFRVEQLAVIVDWKLPRRDTAEEDDAPLVVPDVPGGQPAPNVLEVPVVPDLNVPPTRVLQVPILDP